MHYQNETLKEFKFPIGGIGTGTISLDGAGLLRDFEIFNHPAKYSINGFTHFAVHVEKPDGSTFTRVICGDTHENLCGNYLQNFAHSHGFGFGLSSATMNGFPHFRKVSADAEYPIVTFTFEDEDFPGKITMSAWNPLIPQDSFNSSLPVAYFHLSYTSNDYSDDKVTFAFVCDCPFHEAINSSYSNSEYTLIKVTSCEDKDSAKYGDLSVLCPGESVIAQTHWYRGEWCDGIVTYWNELSSGKISPRSYDSAGKDHFVIAKFAESSSADVDFILAWNVPNCTDSWHNEGKGTGIWKNWYATQFPDSSSTAEYCYQNADKLHNLTSMYCEAMYHQTLPEPIIEAAANTISALRSPTVLRLEDGSVYGFEGSAETVGSCEGTCQHVWNYAYALCFLFPALERSIRDLEFKYELQPSGATYFRLGLPLGSECALSFPCFDGQMGCIIKTYREWIISGDDNWLRSVWDKVKAVLDYARSQENSFAWDADGDGLAEGRMHHTLDMELFGPSGWLQGLYLAALKAATIMARYLGDNTKAEEYENLFASGKKLAEKELWNGEWFVQKVDLTDKSMLERFDCVDAYWNSETKQIKYQISEGCEIDQLLGQWHASILGLGEIYSPALSRKAAQSILKYNYKENFRNFVNPWRLFTVNDEPGTIMCTYPEGAIKPAIPVPYCEESMTGFEYAFAGTLIALGYTEDGIKVASSARSKYTGANRNPFNEIECGSNYIRPMAAYALLPILSGFSFDMPSGKIGFAPKINEDNFKCFWSVGEAFGTYEQTDSFVKFTVLYGNIRLKEFSTGRKAKEIVVDGNSIPFTFDGKTYCFKSVEIKDTLIMR